ncbi:hypothetical protein BGZ49_010545 [Haplosporangium sp. Z 27]|nr:hypothetical protein BGZ49_010545 [Haplosporangium sp. Z 27]
MPSNINTSSFNIDEDLALALLLNDLQDDYSSDYHDGNKNAYPVCDLDSDHNDYGDIYVSPPSQNKSKSRRSKKKKQKTTKSPIFTKIVQPIANSPRPLIFSRKTLGLIFSHLSQSTLRTCISLVCKDWKAVSDQYIRRAGVWAARSEDYQARLLEQMKRLDTLECWFNMDPDVPTDFPQNSLKETNNLWRGFRDSILEPFGDTTPSIKNNTDGSSQRKIQRNRYKKLKKDESHPTCLLHNICKLSLRGNDIRYTEIITTLHQQHGLKFLKTLFLDFHRGTRDVLLFPLLDDCPNLVEFTLRVQGRSTVDVLTGDKHRLGNPDLDRTFSNSIASRQQSYNLEVFDISNCGIMQTVLKRIVSTCPNLRVLKTREHYTPMINHKQLLDHAKKMCPYLEWYSVGLAGGSDDEIEYLEPVKDYFPVCKYLSIACKGDPSRLTQSLVARLLFSQVTVLEVTNLDFLEEQSIILDKILCQTTKLRQLIAQRFSFSISALYTPLEPVVPAPEKYIENNRDRKRQERKDKRKQRQKALQRLQNIGSYTDTPTLDFETPKTWQCHDLRSLTLRCTDITSPFLDFALYIDRNRLFRNLTELKLTFQDLRIGQLQEFPHVIKKREKRIEESESRRMSGLNNLNRALLDPPKRYQNELLPLHGLRSLEYFHIAVHCIPGMIHPSDFEFLMRRSDETVVRIISHEIGDYNQTHDMNSVNNSKDDELLHKESDDDDEYIIECLGSEKIIRKLPNATAETFWPLLQTFHIRYFYMSLVDCSELISGIKNIRPGVEFSIKQRFKWFG